MPEDYNPKQQFVEAVKELLYRHELTQDDRVVYLSGSFAEGGYSSILQIMRVKDILLGNSVTPPKSV